MDDNSVLAILAQYEKNKNNATSGNTQINNEEKLKKFFTTILPKNTKQGEKRIRILPMKDGKSPFVEVKFHDLVVDGQSLKLYDPLQEGKRSPLNEVYLGLKGSTDEETRKLASNYRSKTFYIVKVIDRENEQDGPKFWRFKHNSKGEGIYDKIYPIIRRKGNIMDKDNGIDLILTLSLSKSGNGKEYTTITSIIPDEKSPLHTDPSVAQSWIDDNMVWSDVYSKKPEEYLDIVAKGEIPVWDNENKKFVSKSTLSSTQDETIASNPKSTNISLLDPQENEEGNSDDDDLPF